jgi:hypothetical protein
MDNDVDRGGKSYVIVAAAIETDEAGAADFTKKQRTLRRSSWRVPCTS